MWLLIVLRLFNPLAPVYASVILKESRKHGFDPLLTSAIMYRESRFKNGKCYRGSHGLLQVQLKVNGSRTCKGTMAAARAQKLYDARVNIHRALTLASFWRRWCLKNHKGHHHWLLHFNQGFGRCPKGKRRCKKSERIPILTGKIGGYARRVLKVYEQLKKIKDRVVTPVAHQIGKPRGDV